VKKKKKRGKGKGKKTTQQVGFSEANDAMHGSSKHQDG